MDDQTTTVHSVSIDLLRRLEIFKDRNDFDLSSVEGFHIFHTPDRGCSGGVGYIFLTIDDEVFGFGHNCENINILGVPPSDPQFRQETILEPTRIESLSNRGIQDISIGGLIGAALSSCGTLFWWGLCYKDDELIMSPRSPAAAAKRKFLRVSCGYQIMVALSVNNYVQVWGRLHPSNERFFQGEILNLYVPITDISCGFHHLAMLDSDGFVYTWGRGDEGQRGLIEYSPDQQYVVWKVLREPCSLVKCGPYSTYCLTKRFHEVYCCGSNVDYHIGTLSKIFSHCPITDLAIVPQPNSKELVAACTSESEFYTWGSTPYPVLTNTSSMIEVFALWNTTPGLTHISCLPSVDSPTHSHGIMDDVLNYVYMKDRPELAVEAEILFHSSETPDLRFHVNQIAGKERAGPYILKKFMADLHSENQVQPKPNQEEIDLVEPSNGFQNWLENLRAQAQCKKYQSFRPRSFYRRLMRSLNN